MMYIWILIALVAIWVVSKDSGLSFGKAKSTSLEMLDNRLASGEITEEEYEKLKRLIDSKK